MLPVGAGDPTLLGVAAILTALGGIVTSLIGAWRSGKKAREEAEEECRERLKAARVEAEAAAEELHRLKMGLFGEGT